MEVCEFIENPYFRHFYGFFGSAAYSNTSKGINFINERKPCDYGVNFKCNK